MAKKKNSANIPATIITVIAALLAIGAVIFLIVTISGDRSGGTVSVNPAGTTDADGNLITPGGNDFVATQELLTEVETAAYSLLPDNYKIYQYFTKGMSYKEEPYGNLPEDGFYTCVNDDYKTFEDLCGFIRSTYTESTAEKLITDPFGYGPVYGDDGGVLGLSDKFKETEDSGLSWEDTKFVCVPASETECDIEITLKDKDGKDVAKQVKMIKEKDGWRLAEMIG